MTIGLVIPAAGVGNRFSKDVKKQFYQIDNKPILYFTLRNILSAYNFSEVVIGISDSDRDEINEIIEDLNLDINFKIVLGGETRAHTVMNCLRAVMSDMVLIHDAVRPFVTKETVQDIIAGAIEFDGAVPAIMVRDTVKRVDNKGIIQKTEEREGLYLAHTPQGFKTNIIKNALKESINKGLNVTDESSAMEMYGSKIKIVPSSYDNIKVTYIQDIDIINILKDKYFK